MAWPDRLSLRQRLLLWLLPPILLLTGAWIWATHAIVLHFANLAYDRALDDTVQTLAGQVRIAQGRVEINLPAAARRMLEFDPVDHVYFSVTDEQERQLVSNHFLPPNPFRDGFPRGTRFYDGQVEGQALRLVEYTMTNGMAGGMVFVRVAETLHKREILAREVLLYMMGPQLLFLAGIALLVWYGVGRGVAPLRRIRDAIARRTHDDLSPLDEKGLPAEVHEQVHVINDLMFRLERTITAQRRFIADATHQVRTPIAVLRAQTELALRTDNADDLRAAVVKLDVTTARLARLANQVLNLSRAEAGRADSTNFVRVGIDDLVEDVVAGLVPIALNKQIDIGVDMAQALPEVLADRQLLREMLANLVDNAIRYTPAGGRVLVESRYDEGRIELIVTDNGPGIQEAERQWVIERFYRGINAVSEGSGLGLSIAHEIVLLHGGRLDLASAPDGSGLIVTVDMPIARETRSP